MPRRPAAPAPDPLAHLRAPESAAVGTPPETAPQPVEDLEEEEALARPQEWHDAAVPAIVDRWHGDRVAQSYAHRGGTCGCRYLASMALLEVVGLAAPEPVRVSLTKGGGSGGA